MKTPSAHVAALAVLVFIGCSSMGQEAPTPAATQRDFLSALRLLPEIGPDTPRWSERFSQEMPSIEPPFYGVNLVDVRRENYDAIFPNIERQTLASATLLGGQLHLCSVTDYGEIRRVTWIIFYESFPDIRGPALEQANEGPQDLADNWAEFANLAEGYTWWVTPALPVDETPQVSQ